MRGRLERWCVVLPAAVALLGAAAAAPVRPVSAAGITPTTTTVATSGSPSTYGSTVVFTATVRGGAGTETGSVAFYDGVALLGSSALGSAGSGAAAYSTSSLTPGGHSITARYGGDSNYAGSTSAAIVQHVDYLIDSVGVTSSDGSIAPGQMVTLTADVLPAQPPFAYAFQSDSGDYIGLGQAKSYTVNSSAFSDSGASTSRFTLSISGLGDWWDAIIAAPSGQTLHVGTYSTQRFANTASAGLDVFGDGRGCNNSTGSLSITRISSDASGNLTGIDLTFTQWCDNSAGALHGSIHIGSNPMPTGTVTFHDGSQTLGTASLARFGDARLTTAALTPGTRAISATYSGDSLYESAASSSPATVQVGTVGALNLMSSANPSNQGAPLTFTAAELGGASAPTATGTVTFLDGSVTLARVPLDSTGSASYTTSSLATGDHSIVARYSGDANYAATTASRTQAIDGSNGEMLTSTSLVSSLNPSTLGQTVSFTATVSSPQAADAFSFTSDVGDWVGGGQTRSYTKPTASFSLSGTLGGGVSASVSTSTDWWSIILAPPQGESIAPGVYTNAERAAFRTGAAPGIDISGDGRGCNTDAGRFTITSLTTDPSTGNLTSIDAIFEQQCEGGTPALRGHLHIETRALSGSVTFRDGTQVIGGVTLASDDTATFSTSSLNAGTRQITATYNGASLYVGSTSAAVAQVVQRRTKK